MNFMEGATAIERNVQIGGHRGWTTIINMTIL
jgi:hypothetical protein